MIPRTNSTKAKEFLKLLISFFLINNCCLSKIRQTDTMQNRHFQDFYIYNSWYN